MRIVVDAMGGRSRPAGNSAGRFGGGARDSQLPYHAGGERVAVTALIAGDVQRWQCTMQNR